MNPKDTMYPNPKDTMYQDRCTCIVFPNVHGGISTAGSEWKSGNMWQSGFASFYKYSKSGWRDYDLSLTHSIGASGNAEASACRSEKTCGWSVSI